MSFWSSFSRDPKFQRRLLLVVAWLAILLASNASVIMWRVPMRSEVPGWDPVLRIAILGLMCALSFAFQPIRPLSGFLLALTALLIGNWIGTLFEETSIWESWIEQVAPDRQLLADTFVKLLPAALVGLTVVGMRRSDLFLVKGDLRARSKSAALGHLRWSALGPIVTLLLALPLIWVLTVQVGPDVRQFGRALEVLPFAVMFAAINAASEEFRFRAVLLGRAVPVVGDTQAVWLTATLFGIGHWFGHPSGAIGVVMAGVAGLVLAQSMVDTRGFTWAWLIHSVQDVFIYASVATIPNVT